MLTMAQVENQVKMFSFEEQLHLLAYIANIINVSAHVTTATPQKHRRQPGGLTGKFYMADDFDETP